MLHKTRGIVLHTVNFSETSLIAKIYTEAFGLQSYILKGIRTPRANMRPALFQPFSLLEMVVYRKENRTLHPVKEVRIARPLFAIHSDIRKSSIALFLTELIYRSIREEEADPSLFDFIWDSVVMLESTGEPVSCFHLVFAVKFSRFLGFHPQGNMNDTNRFFHLREGIFHSSFLSAEECLDESESSWFFRLIGTDLDHLHHLTVPGNFRAILLDKILAYYRYHIHGFREIHSHEILHTVLA